MTSISAKEREILKDVIRKYKDSPCLWDRTHDDYSNQVKRTQAYTQILDYYRLYEPNATLSDVKKRMENMRTCYKRIRSKILRVRAQKGIEFEPKLWYYNDMTFLDGGTDALETGSDHVTPEFILQDDNDEEMQEVDFLRSESNPSSPEAKHDSNVVYLNESRSRSSKQKKSRFKTQSSRNIDMESSAELFGRTIGMQLEDLHPVQRYIAEKLITDVIYHARFSKLSLNTTIDLND